MAKTGKKRGPRPGKARRSNKKAKLETDKLDELYGIICVQQPCGVWEWRVHIERHCREIKRNFPVETYGCRKLALSEAKAYRNAVMNLFPAVTNYEFAKTQPARGRSGIRGVYRYESRRTPFWVAALGPKRVSFNINTNGERRAKALAIKARKSFEAELEASFLIVSARSSRS